jgi:F0F1-type ATP synthase membrane subunit b/b'
MIPEFWVGFAVGALVVLACVFVLGAFLAVVNARNERVNVESDIISKRK